MLSVTLCPPRGYDDHLPLGPLTYVINKVVCGMICGARGELDHCYLLIVFTPNGVVSNKKK
jgi:hypothetical protein